MSTTEAHPLAVAMVDAARGSFPAVDGRIDVVPPDAAGAEAVVEFTGHVMVLTRRDPGDGLFRGVDAFGGAVDPRFVVALAGDSTIGSHDVVLVRPGGAPADPLSESHRYDDHPRVLRARRQRRDVKVFGDATGLVTIGTGLVGRTELSVEVAAGVAAEVAAEVAGGVTGTGRRLILGGLATLASTELVFAQVAPGNAASLRAFLACGFRPIGSEILMHTDARSDV